MPPRDTRTVTDVKREKKRRQPSRLERELIANKAERVVGVLNALKPGRPDGAISPQEHRSILREQVRTGTLGERVAAREGNRRDPQPLGKNPGRTSPREGGDTAVFRKFMKGVSVVADVVLPITPNNVKAARAAKDVLLDPRTSRREKLDAASNVIAVGGGINSVPGGAPKKPPEPAASKSFTRPRTREDAGARLAELEGKHDAFFEKVWRMGDHRLSAGDKVEQARRNAESGKARLQQAGVTRAGRVSGSSGRKAKLWGTTVKGEVRAEVEMIARSKIEKLPVEHPARRRFEAEQNEMDELRQVISDHDLAVFDGTPDADFGTKTETILGKPRRVELAAQEAALGGVKATSAGAGKPPPPPRPPIATAAAGPPPPSGPPLQAEQIIGALPEARRLRRQQEQLYSAERGKRAAKAEQAMQVGGQEGYRAALAELKGELPKLKFGALEHFDQTAADELFTHVQRHEALRPYEKISTQTALRKVIEGAVPTRGEIKLMERAFGPDVSAQIAGSIPFWQKAKTAGYSLINVPRALRSSFDLSAPFRQGLVLGARHPKMFSQEFAPMMRSLRSEGAYEDVMDQIASRPTFAKMQKAKLQLTDLQGVTTREEGFMSNLAEHIPVVGIGVRASGRAYTGFLNKFRADAFDNYVKMAEKQGLDIDDPVMLKSIASWVNHATGRGSIKSLEGAMVPLNALLFSPRLIASRLQLLNPAYYAKLDPFARKQALQGMGQLLTGVSLTLWLAKMAGAEVGMDPRSSDFAKIKLGDTRIDIAGGLQQYLVAASRLVKGETVSSTTGEVRELEGGFGKPSRYDIFGNFAENKLAPVPTWGVDFLKNENFAGDKFDPVKEGGRAMLPLGLENAYEGFRSGTTAGIAAAPLGSIGFGVQTYGPKPEEAKSRSLRAGKASKSRSLRAGRSKSKSLRH
ncbi:MAG TPA: hypothetical protein VNI55_01805 [Gaiellaceae bacterium]|nr:hypothetical protein [Gaiellaceae bacterium]